MKLLKREVDLCQAIADYDLMLEPSGRSLGMSRFAAVKCANTILKETGLNPLSFRDLRELLDAIDDGEATVILDYNGKPADRRYSPKTPKRNGDYNSPELRYTVYERDAMCDTYSLLAENVPYTDLAKTMGVSDSLLQMILSKVNHHPDQYKRFRFKVTNLANEKTIALGFEFFYNLYPELEDVSNG